MGLERTTYHFYCCSSIWNTGLWWRAMAKLRLLNQNDEVQNTSNGSSMSFIQDDRTNLNLGEVMVSCKKRENAFIQKMPTIVYTIMTIVYTIMIFRQLKIVKLLNNLINLITFVLLVAGFLDYVLQFRESGWNINEKDRL